MTLKRTRHFRWRNILGLLLLTTLTGGNCIAQSPAVSKVLSLEDALNYAQQNYPEIRAALAELSAAHSGIGLAKTSYLPRADVLWQGNRATRNNISGLLFPQPVISSISGPVLPLTSNDSVWGSAAGLLVSWEPFDFGRRRAAVNAARLGESVAQSELSATRLDVALAVANAFFTVAAAQQRLSAARADVDRRQVFANSVHVLVKNDLRPGADASRADAELAHAQVVLIQAQQAEAISRVALAEVLGIAGTDVQIKPGALLFNPPESNPVAPALSAHPFAAIEQAKVDQIRAQEQVLDRSYFPRFDLQSTIYGRGSGANSDGTIQAGANGLGLGRSNWGAGLTVTFPVLDIFSVHAQKQIAEANERAERARYEQTLDNLTGEVRQAEATLNGARSVAAKTPIELQAARDAETQARARYEAGLANIVEVADAQGLLAQAETDDALAHLAVWNDLASVAAAQGDLRPFIQLIQQTTPGGK
jgi:outer membrane protein